MHHFAIILVPPDTADIPNYIAGRLNPTLQNELVPLYINRHLSRLDIQNLGGLGIDPNLDELCATKGFLNEDGKVAMPMAVNKYPLLHNWKIGGRFSGIWSKTPLDAEAITKIENNSIKASLVIAAAPLTILITPERWYTVLGADTTGKYIKRIGSILKNYGTYTAVVIDAEATAHLQI